MFPLTCLPDPAVGSPSVMESLFIIPCSPEEAITCEDGSPVLFYSQFGFRSGFSMEYPLTDATEFIRGNIDIGLKVIGIFLDFSKAFNMVNNPLLLRELERYGIRRVSLWWFESYFLDRYQCIEIDGIKSHCLPVKNGVPLGRFWVHYYFFSSSTTS
ncbi:hypothetical protein QYM36_007086 [Artemia franciscana]|uniref:Reverse transcriptase domain-containing protein n=1 Tax=Artemia franciscana TaxID=6661 RepID=A0AA88L2T2_ARTSF|nr:hypothetical protein QYM36_007086 [Artemia franciscana]